MTAQPYCSSPRPTTGHHFSDLLTCPQRAWLHYYGNPQDQVKDPAYLRAVQQEGVRHEASVYERCFANALRIPQQASPEDRTRLTIEAMRAGTPAILQGYIRIDDGVGVLDILELVGPDRESRTGYKYRVGEIKRSATLMTAHVMQAAWYTELLEKTQAQKIHEACFFLKSGERHLIDLRTIQADYDKSKADLDKLRASPLAPGPHLLKFCQGCHWRGVCMPELMASRHISLVPGIGRQQANALRDTQVATWEALKTAPDALLTPIGMGPYEIEQVRAAVRCLERGTPPLRQPLRPDAVQNLQIVVLEFPALTEQRRAGERPVPSAILHETEGGQVARIEVSHANGVSTADLKPLVNTQRLAFYGTTDLVSFMQIARQSGFKRMSALDLFMLVDNFVHAPAPGLELDSLYSYVMGMPVQRLSGPHRVAAVRKVVDWVARSL